MSQQNIKNLATLRRRKEELKQEMKLTRQALEHNLQYTRMGVQRYIIYGLLLPLGLQSLSNIVFKQEHRQSEKPQWLLFVEQMIETISHIYEPPEAPTEED